MPSSREHPGGAVYRMYDGEGRLLYVGVTTYLCTRLATHAGAREWWDQIVSIAVEHFPTGLLALAAECEAIHTEHPFYNKLGTYPLTVERLCDGGPLKVRQGSVDSSVTGVARPAPYRCIARSEPPGGSCGSLPGGSLCPGVAR